MISAPSCAAAATVDGACTANDATYIMAGQERIEPGTHIWFVSEGVLRHDAFVRAFCENWGVQVERIAGHVYLVR